MMVLKTFNGVFFLLMGIMIALIVIISLALKNKSEKTKVTFITVFCLINVILFFVYKVLLSMDGSYLEASEHGFNWFNELPLHLCNINMFLVPIGALTKNKGIMGFSFFMAPFGALMALIFPEPAFNGYSFFLNRMWGFYLTHIFIFISGILLRTLNFYRPKIKDLPKVLITIGILGLVITGVNVLIRETGLCPFANYFFTMDDGGVGILAFFWNLVKIPYLYILPAMPILLVYMAVICLAEFAVEKIGKKSDKVTEDEKEKVTV